MERAQTCRSYVWYSVRPALHSHTLGVQAVNSKWGNFNLWYYRYKQKWLKLLSEKNGIVLAHSGSLTISEIITQTRWATLKANYLTTITAIISGRTVKTIHLFSIRMVDLEPVPANTGHEVGIHHEWDAMHTHSHTHSTYQSAYQHFLWQGENHRTQKKTHMNMESCTETPHRSQGQINWCNI